MIKFDEIPSSVLVAAYEHMQISAPDSYAIFEDECRVCDLDPIETFEVIIVEMREKVL